MSERNIAVCNWIREQGGARCAQVAEHFKIGPRAASAILQKMAARGKLEKRHEGRAITYRIAASAPARPTPGIQPSGRIIIDRADGGTWQVPILPRSVFDLARI